MISNIHLLLTINVTIVNEARTGANNYFLLPLLLLTDGILFLVVISNKH